MLDLHWSDEGDGDLIGIGPPGPGFFFYLPPSYLFVALGQATFFYI